MTTAKFLSVVQLEVRFLSSLPNGPFEYVPVDTGCSTGDSGWPFDDRGKLEQPFAPVPEHPTGLERRQGVIGEYHVVELTMVRYTQYCYPLVHGPRLL